MEVGFVASKGEEINEGTEDRELNLESSSNVEDEVPKVGLAFNSEEEVTKYYADYGQRMGFGISKISSKNGDDGKKYFTLACNRARKYISSRKNLLKPNPTTKTQCKARLNVCVCLDGTVVISRVVLEHNHELSPTKARYFRCKKELGPCIERKVVPNDQAGINVSRNFQSLVELNGPENLTFGEKNCRNCIDKGRRLRFKTGDAEAIQNYFVRMQMQNSKFFYVMDVDDKSRLRNVFWADARCRAAYEYFGEVITFDTAYLTNKYNVPFAPFVGVNHHGQSVLLGCALLSNEDTKTFTWLFRTWLECMSGCAPNAIITDQDRTMKNAIEVVFPKARHRWCLWHLMNKVPEMLGRHSDYESIKTLLHSAVYDSQSKNEFMKSWEKMIEDYNLHENEWLKEIYDEKHCWAPVYVIDTFWAGMSTTQRSESINSFFDGYVNSKTTLKQFVEQYENALRDKIEEESLADFSSFNTVIDCVSHFGFESQFQKVFTDAKFKEFQVEVASMMYCNTYLERTEGLISIFTVVESKKVFEKIKDVTFNVSFNEEEFELHCACCLFEFKGILCRHILCVLKLIGKTESVPLNYVLSHWRKDLKRRHTLIKSGFDHLIGNPALQRLNKMCDAFYEVASSGVNTDDDFLKVMNWIKDLKLELSYKETSPGKTKEPFIGQDSSVVLQDDGTMIPRQVTRVVDPIVAYSKGRPPSKREASKVDQIMKKKLARKKTQKNSQKTLDYGSQDKDICTTRVQENESESVLESQMIDGIHTQESTHCEPS